MSSSRRLLLQAGLVVALGLTAVLRTPAAASATSLDPCSGQPTCIDECSTLDQYCTTCPIPKQAVCMPASWECQPLMWKGYCADNS
jgi:hypothetical protein